MIQFNSVFNLEALTIYPEQDHLLILTSRDCSWCQKFKPHWREIEQAVKDKYIVYGLEVDDIGGARIFLQGVWFFLSKQLTYGLGYPSFYKINVSRDKMDLVPTEVYWNPAESSFDLEGLIAHLRKEEEAE